MASAGQDGRPPSSGRGRMARFRCYEGFPYGWGGGGRSCEACKPAPGTSDVLHLCWPPSGVGRPHGGRRDQGEGRRLPSKSDELRASEGWRGGAGLPRPMTGTTNAGHKIDIPKAMIIVVQRLSCNFCYDFISTVCLLRIISYLIIGV